MVFSRPRRFGRFAQINLILCLTLLLSLAGTLPAKAHIDSQDQQPVVSSTDSGLCLPITQRATLAASGLLPTADTIQMANSLETTYPLLGVEDWEQRFLSVWEQEHRDSYLGWSQDENSRWYYFLAYGIDGNTAMYEATGDRRYLDRALFYVNNVVAEAQPSASLPTSQYRDNYLGWVAYESNIQGLEVPLYESYMWRYVTHLLRVIRQTPTLYNDMMYRVQYDSLLAFSEVNIFEKWYTRGESHLFRNRTHMAAHWAYIASNLWLLSSNDARRADYERVFTQINEDLRGQIIPNPADSTALFWNDQWGLYDAPGQDTSHGNNVVAYLVEAYDQNIYWTAADLGDVRDLLVNVLWNGSEAAPTFSGYFDGSDAEGGSFQGDGFVKLGRYFPEVQRLYDVYGGQTRYLTQFYGNAALNARMLSMNGCLE